MTAMVSIVLLLMVGTSLLFFSQLARHEGRLHRHAPEIPTRISQLPGGSSSPKVALLFLTRGRLPLESLWHDFFEVAVVVSSRSKSHRPRETESGNATLSQTVLGQPKGHDVAIELEDLLDPRTGLYRLPADDRLYDDAAASLHDTHNERQSKTLQAPFSALSKLDPAGAIARQDLFSVYTHTRPAFAFPPRSLFAGTQIDRRVFVRWGQYSVAEAMRRLIQAALAEPRNQRFAFLSESCAPLFPPSVVHAQLLADVRSRVSPCPKPGQQGMRWGSYLDRPGLLRRHQWRKSSQWISLVRKHAQVIADDNELSRWLDRQCYSLNPYANIQLPPYIEERSKKQGIDAPPRACVADEHYIPTLFAIHKLGNEVR